MQKCVSISFFTLNALNIKHDERNYFKTNSNPIAAAASHHNLRLFQHRNIIHLLLVYCGGPTPWYLLPDVNAGWKPVCVSFRSRPKIRSSLSLSLLMLPRTQLYTNAYVTATTGFDGDDDEEWFTESMWNKWVLFCRIFLPRCLRFIVSYRRV